MKKIILICSLANLLILGIPCSYSQNVGINNSGATPNVSALLDIDAAGMSPKGLLIPRIALTSATDAATITTPATSLLVYNTNGGLSPAGYYYNQGTSGSPNWVPFLTNNVNAPSAWSLTGNAGTTGGPNFLGTTDNISLRFRTNNTQKMIIDSLGNVGIGNTAPASILHAEISNTTYNAPTTVFTLTKRGDVNASNTQDGAGPQIAFRSEDKDGNSFDIAYINTPLMDPDYNGIGRSGNIVFSTLNSWNGSNVPLERMRIDNAGNVGIGTAGPAYALDVVGQTRCTNGVWLTSDIRFKKEIKPITSCLSNLLKLQAVTYKWKTEEFKELKFTDNLQYGIIAQKLEKIYPDLVSTDEKGYKSVNYTMLTPILIEAIKEQQRQIETQQKTIGNLQEDNKNLKTNSELRISKLEAAVEKMIQTTNKGEAKK